jgi:uncharacterized membrane protein
MKHRHALFSIPFLCLAAALGACSGGGSTTGSCTDGSTLTYASFGQAFMTSYCTSCHGAGRTEAGVVLTSQAAIQARASQIDSVAGKGRSMPQAGSPMPTNTERAQLSEWLACGAP